ncbi:hypothetical protein JKG47_12355 [Acidithiobacillus sp. MC6.1]|nr:hypothetical protein [Acidithiobacillus sp. MC6.1]
MRTITEGRANGLSVRPALDHADTGGPTRDESRVPGDLERQVIVCLEHPARIAHYPETATPVRPVAAPAVAPEESASLRELGACIAQAVAMMAETGPRALRKRYGPISRFLGRHYVHRARVMHDVREVVRLAERFREHLDRSRNALDTVESARREAEEGALRLRKAIDTAITYLQEHPDAGTTDDPMETAPRDRLARRVSQLEVLHATQRISTQQLQIARSRVLDVMERAQEFEDVLYPTWLRMMDLNSPESIPAVD